MSEHEDKKQGLWGLPCLASPATGVKLTLITHNSKLQFPHPNVPVADRFTRIAVRLQFDRGGTMLFIFR